MGRVRRGGVGVLGRCGCCGEVGGGGVEEVEAELRERRKMFMAVDEYVLEGVCVVLRVCNILSHSSVRRPRRYRIVDFRYAKMETRTKSNTKYTRQNSKTYIAVPHR